MPGFAARLTCVNGSGLFSAAKGQGFSVQKRWGSVMGKKSGPLGAAGSHCVRQCLFFGCTPTAFNALFHGFECGEVLGLFESGAGFVVANASI